MIKKILSLILCLTMLATTFVFADELTEEDVLQMEEDWEFEGDEEEVDMDASDDALYGGSDDEVIDNSVQIAETLGSNAFSDIKDADVGRVVNVLITLGFVNGYEDGTFRPENSISRVEFMTILIRTLGIKESEAAVAGYNFYDVTPGTWEYNVMSFAVKNEMLTVYNDNTVRPYEPITYPEAIVAYLKAMGYEVTAELTGGYTYGYETIANKLGINKGIDVTGPMTRATAARLVYNCIKAPINKIISSGTFVSFSNETGENILSCYHDIYYSYGVVNANWLGGIDDYKSTRAEQINIDGKVFEIADKSFSKMLGYKVDYYYTNADNKLTALLLQKHNSVEEITVMADDVVSYSNGTLKYADDNGKTHNIKIEAEHTFIKNGKMSDNYSSKDFKPERGYITVVANDGANYDTVFVNEYYNTVSDTVSAIDGILYITMKYGAKALELDLSDKDIYIDMYTDNARMNVNIGTEVYTDNNGQQQIRTNLPNIPSNAVLSIFADEFVVQNGKMYVGDNAKYISIVINTPQVIGTIDSLGTDTVEIKGKEYEIGKPNFLNEENAAFKVGCSGKFLMDYLGKIVAWTPVVNTNDYVYGYLIQMSKQNGISDMYNTKVLTASGDILKFTIDRKTFINDVRSTSTDKVLERLTNSAKLVDADITGTSQLIKYIADESGYIKKMQTVTADMGVAEKYDEKIQLKRDTAKTTFSYRAELGHIFVNKTVSVDKLTNSTGNTAESTLAISTFAGKPDVIFSVPTTPTLEEEDYSVIEEWLPSNSYKTAELYDVNDRLQPGAVLVYQDVAESPAFSNPILLVEKISKAIDEHGNDGVRLQGWMGAMQFSYFAESEDVVKGVKIGDIVMLKGKNDIIEECEVITNVKDVINANYNDSSVTATVPTTVPQKGAVTFSMYEAYDTDSANKIVLYQRGTDIDGDGKREGFMRASYWHPKSSSFHYGATLCNYDLDSGKFTLSSASISNIKGAAAYGHSSSSKCLIAEQTGYYIRYLLVINVN